MKIINLKAENIKKIKAVDITPTDNTVVITGKNGQGKSSVLDSILYALGGKDALKDTPKPIREGQENASIELDLGDYKVVRTFNKLGTTRLEVLTKEGAKYSSPQSLLDDIVGRIAFDPLAFAQMRPDEQKAVLLDVLGLAKEVEELQGKYQVKYDERRDVGRDLKIAEGHLTSIKVPENAPTAPIDTAKVSQDLREAEEHNRQHDGLVDDLDTANEDVARLEAELKEAKMAQIKATAALKGKKKIDTTALETQINNATALNNAYQEVAEHKKADAQVKEFKTKQDGLTAEMKVIVDEKEKLITSAKLPIDGLNIDAEGVTFNGIPFSQLSSAEQLKVSLAIAMAMNPKLRVMRIMDGSLLDSENMKVIGEMAKAEDYQVWIERVEDAGKVGFLIEDGEVKN